VRRREFITIVDGTTATWPLAAGAQEAGRVYRLPVLSGVAPRGAAELFDGLRAGGLVEGQNLTILPGSFGIANERLAKAASVFVKATPGAILCSGMRPVPSIASIMSRLNGNPM
jgi:putative ABC transport system substrate-binding protein